MSEHVKIVARMRSITGTAPSRRARRAGWLPGVVCAPGGESKPIEMNCHDFAMTLKRSGHDNIIANVAIEGQTPVLALLKEVQYDPVNGTMVHVDFIEVSMTRKMRVAIPIRLAGDAVGVTQQGGVLEHMMRELDVECLPGDIVDAIAVDVSALEIGNSLHVSDLKVDSKLTVLSPASGVIAAVLAPTVEKAEEPAAAEAAAAGGTEPEVIGKKVTDEEGAEAEGEKGKGKAPEKGKTPEKGKEGDKGKEAADKGKEKAKAPAGDKGKK
ncbi:MAG: 50S ribosomal protein L25 [bacterium]